MIYELDGGILCVRVQILNQRCFPIRLAQAAAF